MSGGVTPKKPIPAELDMMNALDNLLSALNDATLVDGEGFRAVVEYAIVRFAVERGTVSMLGVVFVPLRGLVDFC